MRLVKEFEVGSSREDAIRIVEDDATLVDLFPDTETEIVDRGVDRKTTRSKYTALGREGEATFHFTFLVDGNLRFEKVCDGRVWQELRGEVTFEERSRGCRVRIEMEGRTRSLVPEFTIKGPMRDQLEQMAEALRARMEG